MGRPATPPLKEGKIRNGGRRLADIMAGAEHPAPAPFRPSITGPEPALCYRVEQAAGLLNVGLTSVWKFIREGQLQARRMGGSTVITREDLQAFVASCPVVDRKAAQ